MNETAAVGSRPWALVVDDEPQMRTLVEFALQSEGFEVITANHAAEAWERLAESTFDIVILDVIMPGMNGVALCQRIREEWDIPVILVTALGDPDHRIIGFEAGADDYVAKPFHPRELALRASVILRRSSQQDSLPILRNGRLEVNPAERRVSFDGKEIRLSESEFRLCMALVKSVGHPLSYETLLTAVWETENSVGGREMLKTAVWRLRARLAAAHSGLLVENVRGVGYVMPRLRENA